MQIQSIPKTDPGWTPDAEPSLLTIPTEPGLGLMAQVQANLAEAQSIGQAQHIQAKDFVDAYRRASYGEQVQLANKIMSGGELRENLFCVALVALGKLAEINRNLERTPDV